MKSKSTPILLLGVAGLGLSIAMFFDAKNSPTKSKVVAEQPATDIDIIPVSDDELSVIKEFAEERKLAHKKISEEPKEDSPEDKDIDYKSLYLKEKKKNEASEVVVDNSYKGNGTKFSKNLYFMKEAYRRSREAVPVDAAIALAVKLANEKHEDE